MAGYDVSSWYGICAPGGLPRPLLAKLNADLVRILANPDIQQRLSDQGIDVAPSSPEQFLAHIRSESTKWVQVVKAAGLAAE